MQATQQFSTELLLKGQAVSLVFLDVDGVFTDGGLYLDAQGESIKRFHTLDGMGIQLLRQAGIEVVVITGRDSAPLRHRLQALGIEHVQYGTEDKAPAAARILQTLNLDWSQAAAMGDDWPDLALMQRVAFACAPSNAHVEIKAVAHHITERAGGHGAARELCDLVLVASGRYADLWRGYLA